MGLLDSLKGLLGGKHPQPHNLDTDISIEGLTATPPAVSSNAAEQQSTNAPQAPTTNTSIGTQVGDMPSMGTIVEPSVGSGSTTSGNTNLGTNPNQTSPQNELSESAQPIDANKASSTLNQSSPKQTDSLQQ